MNLGTAVSVLSSTSSPAPRPERRLVFRNKGRIVYQRMEDISHILSDGNYVFVFTEKEKQHYRETMAGLESKLDPALFARIHRTVIVNLNRVREIQYNSSTGEAWVLLANGQRLPLSRSHRPELTRRMAQQTSN